MTEQVHIIEDFNTSIGHIIIVKNDRIFRVGQTIEADGKRYSVKGFPTNSEPDFENTAMIVTKAAS